MMLVFCLLVLASYIASMTRSTTETELNSADSALILLAGWLGLVLMAGDAFPSPMGCTNWFAASPLASGSWR